MVRVSVGATGRELFARFDEKKCSQRLEARKWRLCAPPAVARARKEFPMGHVEAFSFPVGPACVDANVRALWKGLRLLCKRFRLITIAVVFLATVSHVAAEVPAETQQALDAIVEALKAVQHPATGKGTALLTSTRQEPGEGVSSEELQVDFRFKHELTRSDVYASDGKERGPWKSLWAIGRQARLVYADEGVDVKPKGALYQFHRQFGRDFHPEVFNQRTPKPLWKTIEHLKTLTKPTVTVSLEDDGVVHVVSHIQDGEGYSRTEISLDPSIGYRLVGSTTRNENVSEVNPLFSMRYKAEWKQYDGEWYVEKAVFEQEGIHVEPEGGQDARKSFKSRTEVSVLDFTPNVTLSDAEFSLEGLSVPQGTLIVDDVVGVHYRYGETSITEEDLTAPLFG